MIVNIFYPSDYHERLYDIYFITYAQTINMHLYHTIIMES